MKWSAEQQAIFNFGATMPSHLAVIARAGTGKTTTIVELQRRLPRGSKVCYGFNKVTALALQARLGNFAESSTLHSAGLKFLTAAFGRLSVDTTGKKAREICRAILSADGINDPDGTFKRAIAFAKATLASSDDAFAAIVRSMLAPDDDADVIRWTARLKTALKRSAEIAEQDHIVDYDDMVWLPWFFDLRAPSQYQFVTVDEAQDMSPCQLWLARAVLAPGGRMIIVGDDRQAIYAWRGADPRALPRMIEELNAHVLTLTITRRCPRLVVSKARGIVADFQSAEDAPEGTLIEGAPETVLSDATRGDFILSRTNAPLMPLALSALARGIPAVVAGRDVAASLLSLIDRAKQTSIDGLLAWLDGFVAKQTARLSKKEGTEDKLQTLADQQACIEALATGLDTVADLRSRIDNLFVPEENPGEHRLVLSTVHRAKGLERNRVYVLDNTFKVKGTEEQNLRYVAWTRAKDTLVCVNYPSKA